MSKGPFDDMLNNDSAKDVAISMVAEAEERVVTAERQRDTILSMFRAHLASSGMECRRTAVGYVVEPI